MKMKAWRRAAELYNSKCCAIFRRIKAEFDGELTQEETEKIIEEFGKDSSFVICHMFNRYFESLRKQLR